MCSRCFSRRVLGFRVVVLRRSLNLAAPGKRIDKPKLPKVRSKGEECNRKVEKLSVTFRDNILYIFSYLLHGRENGLTEDQYTSLQMLYDISRKQDGIRVQRLVHMSVLSERRNREESRDASHIAVTDEKSSVLLTIHI